jgi:type I restriction enzyme M protein
MLNAETKRHIDAARDVLVGVAPNPMTQIDQITYALIYKFMDDMDQAAIKAGGEPSFFISELEPYAWSKLVDSRMGNQEKMNLYGEALQKFAEAKQLPELFRTIFRAAFLPYRSPETLGLFLKEINFFDYSHPEELGNAYEYLLSIMSAQGDAGQFRTPRHIIDFIVDVINPTKSDTVLDPACGTGGFLVSSYNHILEQHDGRNDPSKQEKPLTPDERKKLMNNFEGYDIDPSMVRIAQVNMYLHQFKNPKIVQYDSLTSEERWNDKFDVILANPPFMSPKGGIKPHNKFALQSNRSEVLFVDYIVNHLKPNGRAGIIVPEGIIFQGGKAYKQLRKELVEGGLYAVVSLPSGVFNPYSGVKTSILLLDKNQGVKLNDLLFCEVKDDGTDLGAKRKITGTSDLPMILESLQAFLQDSWTEDLKGQRVSKAEILSNPEVTLSHNRYSVSLTASSDYQVVKIGSLLERSETSNVGSRQNIPVMSITMKSGLVDQGEKFKKRVASEDISNYKLVSRNQLVIGFPIDEGVLGFQKKHDFAAVSPAYEIWTLKNTDVCDIEFLERILRSERMRVTYSSLMQGSVSRRRSLPKGVFEELEIPLPPLEVQEQIVAELDGYSAVIDGAKKILENWKPRIDVDPEWEQVSLNEVATVSAGNSAPQGDQHYQNGTNYFFRTSDVGAVHLHNNLKATRDLLIDQSTIGMKKFPIGTILFPKSGASTFLNHRVMMGVDGYVSSHLATIKANNEVMEDLFLYYLLIGVDARSLTADQSYPSLRLEEIGRISIPKPPLSVQQEAVANLLRLEESVSAASKLASDLESRISRVIGGLWNE